MRNYTGILGALFLLGILALGFTVGCARYRECRAHGFSRFYCATQK